MTKERARGGETEKRASQPFLAPETLLSFFFFFFDPLVITYALSFHVNEKRICSNVFPISTERERAPNLTHMFLHS